MYMSMTISNCFRGALATPEVWDNAYVPFKGSVGFYSRGPLMGTLVSES